MKGDQIKCDEAAIYGGAIYSRFVTFNLIALAAKAYLRPVHLAQVAR
jgi:hypothetical protein